MKWFLLFLLIIEIPIFCLFYKFVMGVEVYGVPAMLNIAFIKGVIAFYIEWRGL